MGWVQAGKNLFRTPTGYFQSRDGSGKKPVLLGQQRGMTELFSKASTKLAWKNGTYG